MEQSWIIQKPVQHSQSKGGHLVHKLPGQDTQPASLLEADACTHESRRGRNKGWYSITASRQCRDSHLCRGLPCPQCVPLCKSTREAEIIALMEFSLSITLDSTQRRIYRPCALRVQFDPCLLTSEIPLGFTPRLQNIGLKFRNTWRLWQATKSLQFSLVKMADQQIQ